MPNHPGDPRSDALGEIPFDPNEYPGPPPVPPKLPPPPPNAGGYTPYRGAEQHGVQFQYAPNDSYALAGEDQAVERYTDADQRILDINPVPPIRVAIVEQPNLILPRRLTTQSYSLTPATSYTQVAAQMQLRKSVKVYVVDSAGGSVSAYLSTSPDAIPGTSKFVATTGGALELYNGHTNDALYVDVAAANSGTAIVSVEQEFINFEGEKLL